MPAPPLSPEDPDLLAASPSNPIGWRSCDPNSVLSCLLGEGAGNTQCVVSLSDTTAGVASIIIGRLLTCLLGGVKI